MKFSFFKQFTISHKNPFKNQESRKEGRRVVYFLKEFLLNLIFERLDYNKMVIQAFNGNKT